MEINHCRRLDDTGHPVYRNCRRVLCPYVGIDEDVRESGETGLGRAIMSWLHVISGLISVGLLIYLFIALLKPEKFE